MVLILLEGLHERVAGVEYPQILQTFLSKVIVYLNPLYVVSYETLRQYCVMSCSSNVYHNSVHS